ncbi:carbohydrate porin [Beijerinckia sp. L45]|uniref:carbohydrate porin n=1 Tax=Beijerinckia sp. L45 TaxID=1641855 RepID=UPI00131DB9D7|nr:carbohydrate porin [Beijerinckia sp. L45]
MRLMKIYKSIVAASFLTVSIDSVSAQQAQRGSNGTNDSPLTKPSQPSSPYPDSGTPDGYLFNLRPLGAALGRDLADQGIYLTGRTLQQAIGDTSGGRKQGAFYEGFNLFGVDLDMNKIAGISGGSFHILLNELAGLSATNYSGSLYEYNRAFGGIAAVRLNEFSYEQSFFSNRLDIRVGRVPVGTEFDYSPVYCEFIYSTCGLPAGYAYTKGYPSYLTASSAAVAKIDLTHHAYFNIGAFEDEPSLALLGHLGFPGEDWGPEKIRGVTVPVQIGYRTTFKDEAYPRAFSFGADVDTGDYNDPLANAAGRNRVTFGGAPRLDHGKSGIWLQAEQVAYRPDLDTQRNLTLFTGANIQTSGNSNIDNAYFAGISYRGPFGFRPNDTFNVLGNIIHLDNAYTAYVNSTLHLHGMAQAASSTEGTIEVNYGVAVAPGVTLKPSFTYIINPDQVGFTPTAANRHAVFIGLALSAFLPETLGMPRLGAQ